MNLADPAAPFFSYRSHKGELLVCLIGGPEGAGVSYQAFRKDLDLPTHGIWNPREGTLALHGDDGFVEMEALVARGPYVVVELDGSLTVERSGERHLTEGEFLITPRFLDALPAGQRHDSLLVDVAEDEDDASALPLMRDDLELGRTFSVL
jgi:hypothetical protein